MYVVRVVRCTVGEIRQIVRGGTPTHSRLRDRLVALLLMTVGIDLICAVLALLFEHGGAQSEVSTFGSAMFWTSTQLLTVSSNIKNPVSTPGRILDVAMEIYAISVVGGIAGSLGAFLIKRGEELEQAAEKAKQERPPGARA
jgi:hypothetical protein